jgi:hypothetical protein
MAWEGNVKRLSVLLVTVLASSWLVHAQQTTTRLRSVPQVEDAAAVVEPSSLVGLTKPQVEARLGKASAAFARIWNYKQRKGTLHVRFGRDGVVSDAQLDLEPRSSGRG